MLRRAAKIPRGAPRSLGAASVSPQAFPAASRNPIHPVQPATTQTRSLFSFLRRSRTPAPPPPPAPLLSSNDLFHPLSQSPFPALVDKANRVKAVSLCPVSFEKYNERLRPAYDCPKCGWPTHASHERWLEGQEEHEKYWPRLREVNEDEHDIRSGRRMTEFENMPEGQAYEAAINFTSWDTFFFTRNFPSIDSDRAIRHVSKLLTYPITIASVLHQNGPYTAGNARITPEGRRSMAALHSVLHLPPGSSIEQTQSSSINSRPSPPFRIFLLGARAESTLPPGIWEQLVYLFPRTTFHIYFIGPEVGLPLLDKASPRRKHNYSLDERGWGVPSYTINHSAQLTLTSLKAGYEEIHDQLGPFDPYNDVFFAFSPGLGFPHQPAFAKGAAGSTPEGVTSTSSATAGETTPPTSHVESPTPEQPEVAAPQEAVTVTETETETETDSNSPQPLVQAQTTWATSLRQILTTKCPLFFTAFSPLDLERDVSALYSTTPPTAPSVREFPEYVNLPTKPIGRIHGVTDEFELVLTPGRNVFTSEKWEIAEWDVRVGVKTNWGIWGIRGKKYEVVEGEEGVER